jgi:hypothetical protein
MAEFYTGQVINGVIVLDEGTPPLPEGMRIRVEPVDLRTALDEQSREKILDGTRAMLLAWAKKAEAIAPDLPSDLAENHDHYAHGSPRE